MNQANRERLNELEHHKITAASGFIRNLSGQERDDMQRIMREEFQPGYATDLWCNPCVFAMVVLLFQKYDAFKIAETATVQKAVQEIAIVPEPKPKPDVVLEEPKEFIDIPPSEQTLATDSDEDFSPAPIFRDPSEYVEPAGGETSPEPVKVKTSFPKNVQGKKIKI